MHGQNNKTPQKKRCFGLNERNLRKKVRFKAILLALLLALCLCLAAFAALVRPSGDVNILLPSQDAPQSAQQALL